MTDSLAVDVLICGAGAAGLTLAIELARRGISLHLIEKMPTPFPGSRGKGIQPRTQEIFEDLGVLDQLLATGGLYPPLRQYLADGTHSESSVIDSEPPTPAEPYHHALLVPQFLTEQVLRERLLELGQRPAFACELVGFVQDAQGVTATVRTAQGEETIRARYLIGADGGRSFVRHALGIGFTGKTLGARALVADVHLTGLQADSWHQFNQGSPSHQLAICPLAGTELFQIQAPVPMEGDVDLSPAGLTALVAARSGRSDIAVQSVSWASAYTMSARLADRYRVERILLIGDAAHVHPPTGGQGLNTSVQDAYNLGWKLSAVIAGAPDALLDSYEEERRPIAANMLELSSRLLDAAKRGEMRRGREVRQLDLGYRQSSLALPSQRVDGPLAGDRAPDAPLRGAAGQPTRLFELLRGTHWTLLGYETRRKAVAPRPGLRIHMIGTDGDLLDQQNHFRHAYAAAAGDWILIRPDGYIAAMVKGDDLASLESFLQLQLPR